MPPTDPRRERKRTGAEPWVVNLVVAVVVVALIALMFWLARELTHASNVIDCAARGIRNCR